MEKPAAPGDNASIRIGVVVGLRPPGARKNTCSTHVEADSGTAIPCVTSEDGGLSDAWLVELARHGDHQAFAALVGRYERKLIRVLARLVREPEQACDLAQETFWRVYNYLDRFDTARRFGPWLFRIGINLALDWLRSRPNEQTFATLLGWHPYDGTQRSLPEVADQDPRARAELAQEVQFVLTQMPVTYRTVLVLRDLEGFTCSEVAAIVGKPEATVRWRLYMAREKFREIWTNRQDGTLGKTKHGRPGHENANG
jgi:RNA polymerase sigma-70 factor, ECF subfamily